jgi:hypothetical protein
MSLLRQHLVNLRSARCHNKHQRLFSVLARLHRQRQAVQIETSEHHNNNKQRTSGFQLTRLTYRRPFIIREPSQSKLHPSSESRPQRSVEEQDALEETTNGHQQLRSQARRHAKLEIKHSQSPQQLIVRLRALLQEKDGFRKALSMAEILSKPQDKSGNVALTAWNVLINDALKSKPAKVNAAFKLLNDVSFPWLPHY